VTKIVDCCENFKKGTGCLDICQHFTEGQFLTTTDAPALSLAGSCQRKVGSAELVEIFECLAFFWIP